MREGAGCCCHLRKTNIVLLFVVQNIRNLFHVFPQKLCWKLGSSRTSQTQETWVCVKITAVVGKTTNCVIRSFQRKCWPAVPVVFTIKKKNCGLTSCIIQFGYITVFLGFSLQWGGGGCRFAACGSYFILFTWQGPNNTIWFFPESCHLGHASNWHTAISISLAEKQRHAYICCMLSWRLDTTLRLNLALFHVHILVYSSFWSKQPFMQI